MGHPTHADRNPVLQISSFGPTLSESTTPSSPQFVKLATTKFEPTLHVRRIDGFEVSVAVVVVVAFFVFVSVIVIRMALSRFLG